MRQKITRLISLILVLDLLSLILLGKVYTKLMLIAPVFYAHDLILWIMVLLCIPHFKFKKRIKSIEILFLMAIVYLVYSFFDRGIEHIQIVLRQFMIFGYGMCLYVIMNRLFTDATINNNFMQYMFCFGLGCVIVQTLYLPYLFFYGGITPFFERRYFSPMVVMGFFVAASYILVNVKSRLLKHLLFLFVFFVSFSTGHDSTYLSLAMIYMAYLFVISSRKYKIIWSVSILAGIILIFAFIPSFTDVNVKWRLLFWKDSLCKVVNNYFVLGDGFGIPYATNEAIKDLNALYPDMPFSPRITEAKKHLTASHNSFLSMAVHIGVLSIVFLFYPLKRIFSNKNLIMDKEILFLSLSLLGMVVFSAFNVILELPHASSIFWIVLFGLIFKLSEKSKAPTTECEF